MWCVVCVEGWWLSGVCACVSVQHVYVFWSVRGCVVCSCLGIGVGSLPCVCICVVSSRRCLSGMNLCGIGWIWGCIVALCGLC